MRTRTSDTSSQTESWQRLTARRRARVFAYITSFLFLVLLARLWYLQILLGEELLKSSEINRTRLLRTPGPRGVILDARGKVLADNRQSVSLLVMPDYAKDNPELLKRLAPLIGVDVRELEEIVKSRKNSSLDPIRVAVDVDKDTLARIEENRMYLAGLVVRLTSVRHYPDGKLGAHVLGPVGEVSEEELPELRRYGYRPGDFVGKSGVERTYNRYLGGVAGGDLVEVDARGRITRTLSQRPPRVGATLVLAIDSRVQRAAAEALAGRPGAAVALDPRDGSVLALVSSPSYDLNLFAKRIKPEVWRALVNNPKRPLLNRAVSSAHPPGSTFKVVTASAGLKTGFASLNTRVYCAGGIPLGGRFKRCWRRHGNVDFIEAIAQSCDTFFYRLSLQMGINPLLDMARAYGLGSRTGIDIPSEARGNIPVPRERSTPGHPRNWWPGDTANAAIGQGYILATPLQMALVAAAVGNGGIVYQPHVARRVVSQNGKVLFSFRKRVLSRLPLAPEKLELVRRSMKAAVEHGTCRGAALPNISVAGKTGSAEVAGSRLTHGWFICFAPYENPTIAVAVILEKAGHGGTVAVPVARKMLEAYFGIRHTESALPARTD